MRSDSIFNPAFYREHLLKEVIPFWLHYAIDSRNGGLFTCIRDDGSLLSRDKYLWSQCRAIWTFSALHNHIQPSPEYLQIAEATAEFVLAHGRDTERKFCYKLSAEGEVLEGAISIYADLFAAYGLAELYRATQKEHYLNESIATVHQAIERMQKSDFNDLAPYPRAEGVGMIHGPAMILLESAQEVLLSAPTDARLQKCCAQMAEQIMSHHVRDDLQVVLENLDPAGNPLPHTSAGRLVNPGHTIESMWFVIHYAQRHGNIPMAKKACEVIRWHLEKGWDTEFGGLFLALDIEGKTPCLPHAEKKIWWPHTEALYALHLAHTVTGEKWCIEWLEKILDYSFSHFPDRTHGEWHQRLDREGNIVTEVVALPVKDPFHLPRALIRTIQLLEKTQS